MMMNILEEAQQAVYSDRQEDYGKVSDNFAKIAQMWSVITGIVVTPEMVGLMMVTLKVCRQLYKAKRDNLVDGAGYFATIEKMQEEIKSRNEIHPG